jgi:hypothetical protein
MIMNNSEMIKLQRRRQKFEATAADNAAAAAERAMAQKHIDKIRVQLDEIPPDAESWNEDVAKGRELLETIDLHQWEMGEQVHSVVTKYGEANLEKYAGEVGSEFKTLSRYRDTWRAWFEKAPRGANSDYSALPVSYSVARALNAYEDKWEYIEKHPKCTKREAEEFMRALKGPKPMAGTTDLALVKRAISALKKWPDKTTAKLFAIINGRKIDPDLQKQLDEAINQMLERLDIKHRREP